MSHVPRLLSQILFDTLYVGPNGISQSSMFNPANSRRIYRISAVILLCSTELSRQSPENKYAPPNSTDFRNVFPQPWTHCGSNADVQTSLQYQQYLEGLRTNVREG